MGFYERHIGPRLVSCLCGMKPFRQERERIVPEAQGRVLEIGFGSGHNAAYYDRARISHLYALEPSQEWRRLGRKRVEELPFPVEWLDLPGEQIPLPDASVDTVLTTFTLCTIADVDRALAGMRRVLKPGGRLVFLEHGLAPDRGVAAWQNRLNGVWNKLIDGCNLNRSPDLLIGKAGFQIDAIRRQYVPGAPKIAGFVTAGVALR